MAHSLTLLPLPLQPISTKSNKDVSSLRFQKSDDILNHKLLNRRTISLGLTGALVGFNFGDGSADAAARRPPPPPPGEKKDPNVSGVLAKVLASKKRKEAMKASVAKLKEKGKPIDE